MAEYGSAVINLYQMQVYFSTYKHLSLHQTSLYAVKMRVVCFLLTTLVWMSRAVQAIGNVHTSIYAVERLVNSEDRVVQILQKYLEVEEERINAIRKYVESWNHPNDDYVNNPLSSYHFLKRLTYDFANVRPGLTNTTGQEVWRKIEEERDGLVLPSEADVNGAAYSIVKLQDVYNLSIDDLVQGNVLQVQSHMQLSADDCLRFGKQSFQNLDFELSEKWTSKGVELLKRSDFPLDEVEKEVSRIGRMVKQEGQLKTLLTGLVKDSEGYILERLSGLGAPLSFTKKLLSKESDLNELKAADSEYRHLCRDDSAIHNIEERYAGAFRCGFMYAQKGAWKLNPFKVELLWNSPVVLLYHDAISDREIDLLKHFARPLLATTKIHSFTSHTPRKSLSRIGQTAWVRRGVSPAVDRIVRRISAMTGLDTASAEDLHVLNYGVGGQYDMHVDFFDLHNKSLSSASPRGDRIATFLFYLNDVTKGGATVFPTLGLRVPPKKGSAIFWFNLLRNGKGDYRTSHASCPVLLGEKWITNLWIHDVGNEFVWPCSRNFDE